MDLLITKPVTMARLKLKESRPGKNRTNHKPDSL